MTRGEKIRIAVFGPLFIFALWAYGAPVQDGKNFVGLSSEMTGTTKWTDGSRYFTTDTKKHYLRSSGTWSLISAPTTTTCSGTDKFNSYDALSGGFTCTTDQTAAPGSGAAVGDTVVTEQTYSLTSTAGTSTFSSRLDHTHGSANYPTLDQIRNPDADKTFTMANKVLKYSYTTPAGGDGAFEIEGIGGFSGDLLHVHQHTGNPGTGTDLVHAEATDPDVVALRLTHSAATYTAAVITGKVNITGQLVATNLTGTNTGDQTVPSSITCSGTDKLSAYSATTGTFACSTDQTGAGGGLSSKLTATYTNSTTTGTEVTELQISLSAGTTYRYSCFLLARNATVANAMDFGVNYTGTQQNFVARLSYNDTGTTATTGTADDVISGDGGELIVAQCVNTAESTTSPNLNCITSFTTAAGDHFIIIEGVLVTGTAGDLEIWAASESTTAATLSVGSNCMATAF